MSRDDVVIPIIANHEGCGWLCPDLGKNFLIVAGVRLGGVHVLVVCHEGISETVARHTCPGKALFLGDGGENGIGGNNDLEAMVEAGLHEWRGHGQCLNALFYLGKLFLIETYEKGFCRVFVEAGLGAKVLPEGITVGNSWVGVGYHSLGASHELA